MNPLRSSLSVLLLVLVGACRTPPERGSTPSPECHPACPGAAQGALSDAGSVLRGETQATPAPADEHAPSTAAYLCPMHPWIGAAQPGRCSLCNMQLVERAKVLEHDHAH